MALIKCSECKKEISDKAVTCPHCGAPVILAVVPKVDMAQKQREERHRKEKLDQEELEQIAKLPPAKRLAAEKKRKERLVNEEKNNKLSAWITIIVTIALMAVVVKSCQKTPEERKNDLIEKMERTQEGERIGKENAAEDRIRAGMKNPDSYEHVGTSYGLDSVGRETVTFRYRGTNGFGGIVTEEQTVLVN